MALSILSLAWPLCAEESHGGLATYIANEGLLVERGELRVLFDPLFHYPHDYYQRVPPDTEKDIIAGSGNFTSIDAAFISHFHADHFSPALILEMLRRQQQVVLFAPGQAVSALHLEAGAQDAVLFERVQRIDLAYGDTAVEFVLEGILVEALLIPHSGWPGTHQHVDNLSYRVTLDGETSVVHMGDADPRLAHFQPHEDYWSARRTDAAFPPYWFFLQDAGLNILNSLIRAERSVGMHVPADPAQRPGELGAFDVFTRPGETRQLE